MKGKFEIDPLIFDILLEAGSKAGVEHERNRVLKIIESYFQNIEGLEGDLEESEFDRRLKEIIKEINK